MAWACPQMQSCSGRRLPIKGGHTVPWSAQPSTRLLPLLCGAWLPVLQPSHCRVHCATGHKLHASTPAAGCDVAWCGACACTDWLRDGFAQASMQSALRRRQPAAGGSWQWRAGIRLCCSGRILAHIAGLRPTADLQHPPLIPLTPKGAACRSGPSKHRPAVAHHIPSPARPRANRSRVVAGIQQAGHAQSMLLQPLLATHTGRHAAPATHGCQLQCAANQALSLGSSGLLPDVVRQYHHSLSNGGQALDCLVDERTAGPPRC